MTEESNPKFIEYIKSLNDSSAIRFIDNYSEADIVLVPTKRVVYVRGNKVLKGHINRTFRGRDKLAKSLAYADGISRAISTIRMTAPIPSSGVVLTYGIRLD